MSPVEAGEVPCLRQYLRVLLQECGIHELRGREAERHVALEACRQVGHLHSSTQPALSEPAATEQARPKCAPVCHPIN